MQDVEIIGIVKSYVKNTLKGMGALKGSPCEILSITETTGGHVVTFKWVDSEEVEHTNTMTVLDGTDGTNGTDGVSPTVTVKISTDTDYVLTITDVNGSYDTPNLKGSGGGGGGVPTGGTEGQALVKNSSTNYDTKWRNVPFSMNGQKAVVIGDSYFNNPNTYNFATYLRAQGIYSEVFDYGLGGSGFGHTKSNTPTLMERLANSQMRADIANADVLYLHLGGNDMLANVGETQPIETDLWGDVTDSLDEIIEINPDIKICFIPWGNFEQIADSMWVNASLGVTNPFIGQILTTTDVLHMFSALNIIQLAIASSSADILQLNLTSSLLVAEYGQNDIHPTAEAAQRMFHGFVYGEYEKPIVRDIMYDFTETTETASIASTLYQTLISGLKANMMIANYSLNLYVFETVNNSFVLNCQKDVNIKDSHAIKMSISSNLETLIIDDYGAELPPTSSPTRESYNLAKLGAIPSGGTAGQVITKKSGTDYDTEWVDLTGVVTEIVNGYPSYVDIEKKAVLSRLWTTYASVHNPVVVGFNTDQHLHNNVAVERVAILTGLHALRDMTKEFPFNVCVLGGDACGNSTIQAICNEVNDVTNALDGANCPVIHISGNHDSWNNNNNMIKGQLFSALATSTFKDKVVTTTDNTNNCYYDDEVNQIRYIFLNDSSMRGYDLNKINVRDFMIDALETLPDFFAAIIFSHHPLGNLTDAPHTRVDDWNDPLNFGDYVAPYKNKIIACICGHVHADKHEILDGILYLSTTCAGRTELNDGSTRTDGQADVTAQDVMVIDREHYVIHCIRYGNGNDRNITYYVPTYTNVLATAIDTDGEIFNGVGYQEGKRLNSSGGTTDYDISDVSGYIPVNANDVIRIRGAFMSNKKDTIINYINFYNSDFSFKSGKQAFNWWLGKDTTTSTHDIKEMTANNGNVVEFKVPESSDFNGSYMRVSCELLSQAVITINEDIPLK